MGTRAKQYTLAGDTPLHGANPGRHLPSAPVGVRPPSGYPVPPVGLMAPPCATSHVSGYRGDTTTQHAGPTNYEVIL